MDQKMGWPSALVALGFLALVGLMFWQATQNMNDFDKIWSAAGPVLGVAVGAIPGFFFAQNARRDSKDANQKTIVANQRAEAYAAALPDDQQPKALEWLKNIRNTTDPA